MRIVKWLTITEPAGGSGAAENGKADADAGGSRPPEPPKMPSSTCGGILRGARSPAHARWTGGKNMALGIDQGGGHDG